MIKMIMTMSYYNSNYTKYNICTNINNYNVNNDDGGNNIKII